MSFTTLGLSQQILDAIKTEGYSEPSPIQEKSIHIVLEGKEGCIQLYQQKLLVILLER